MTNVAARFATAALLAAGLGACSSSAPVPPSPETAAAPSATAPRDGRADSVDGVTIAYTVRGRGAPALVFLHGWMCDRGYWAEQVDAFDDTLTVVTIDLAGHGESGTTRDDWAMPAFGRDVEAVVAALGLDSVILVGHSMGGVVALEAAARLPGKVVGVIGVDTLHNFEAEWPEEQFEPLVASFRQDFRGTCGRFVESMFLEGADPGLRERTVDDMCSASPGIALALLEGFRRVNYPELVRAAGVPIRCINSAAYPTAIEINRKHAPGFDAQVVQGVGHFLHMERPAEFNALLQRAVEELTGPGQP